MEMRQAVHDEQAKTLGTELLRKHFLIEELFSPRTLNLVYSYYDRMIVGGIIKTANLITGGKNDP